MPADHSADLVPAARPAVLPLQESHVHAATLQESGFPDIAQTLPAAVLWDMDGTLIDSECLWSVSLHDTARELGGTLGPQARESLTGVDIDTSIRVLLDEVGRPATPELVAATRERLLGATAALFDGGVDWLPGARDALRTVRATGLPTALVTNSVRQIAELALDGIGRGFFDVTVCGDEVPTGKPAPDPYLRAAELLGVPAESCLVVEDSHNGALAGERAGAAVLVVAGEVPVPAGPRRTHRRGLVGLSTAELAAAADLPAARDVRVA
jgi:HAD superfamily hydrolase (TIGR01509 family)